ncbi:MAG TPA: putative baseplate assembly protein [Candidatus Acidoferrales bacterium]|nr:putative baseplate assembly protein [Candidatus Acidoferrales bacterium]
MPDAAAGSTCGCCSGIGAMTPALVDNRPGLSAIGRRVGTYAAFRSSIEARLSARDVAALGGLGTRADDDPTIALIDAFSVMADVLTFYGERIANEAYLRTATERRSVLELGRLIGYRLAPGRAADAELAFTLDEPALGPRTEGASVIPARTRVQSIPGPGEAAQTFETSAAFSARAEWSAMALQTTEPQPVAFGQRSLVVGGTDHNLAPGDVVLIVGDERLGDAGSERWDVRLIRSVSLDARAGTTRLTWLEGLGSVMPRVNPAADNPRAWVFRQRAPLFGHNAPDPRLMSLGDEAKAALIDNLAAGTWKNFGLAGKSIDLDQSYPKIVPGSWLVLLSEAVPHFPSSLPGYAELYRARTVGHQSISAFGLASKVTRVGLDTDEHLSLFTRRETLVLCQSEELEIVARPVVSPVYGSGLAFAELVPGLASGQSLAIAGAAQHLRVTPEGEGTSFTPAAGAATVLQAGDRLAMAAPPTAPDGLGGQVVVDPDSLADQLEPLAAVARPQLTWYLEDRDGRAGVVRASAAAFSLDPAIPDAPGAPGDPVAREIVRIGGLADDVVDDRDRTRVNLAAPTARPYDRASVRVNANVVAATHGETVRELLGGGDGSRRNQRFSLRQKPLTYVGSTTPAGRASSLEVRVDGTAWTEVDSLYGAGPSDRVHTVEIEDDGTANVVFGDGAEGARLSTAPANVRATYRKGIGTAGNVRAGQLATLFDRPAGVTAVMNPAPAAGGQEPESLATARTSAPKTVLTLGRAVSRSDYAAFAAVFAGVSKADASWIPSGPRRGVAVTVAGPAGAAIDPTSVTHDRLVEALRSYGDRLLPIRVVPYRDARFKLSLDVKVDAAEDSTVVTAAVGGALRAAFAFEARAFGQGVSLDEVVSIAHGVRGVVAVDVNLLRRNDDPASPAVRPRLGAAPAGLLGDLLAGAELLTLDATTLGVGTMP